MVGGSPTFCGTFSELRQRESASSTAILDDIKFSGAESNEDEKKKRERSKRRSQQALTESDGYIMTEEGREYGIASLSTWATWFRHAGGWPYVLSLMVSLLLDRGIYVSSDAWIAFWSGNAFEGGSIWGVYFPPQTDGRSAQAQYVFVYAILITLSTVASFIRGYLAGKSEIRQAF